MLLLVVHIRGGLYNVHIAGGSSQNQLLCQIAADATQRPVIAGPVEATALDNASVQWIAMGVSALLPRQAPWSAIRLI